MFSMKRHSCPNSKDCLMKNAAFLLSTLHWFLANKTPLPRQSFQFPLLNTKNSKWSVGIWSILSIKRYRQKWKGKRKDKGRKDKRKIREEGGKRVILRQHRMMGCGTLKLSKLHHEEPKGKQSIHKIGTGCYKEVQVKNKKKGRNIKKLLWKNNHNTIRI